MVNINVWEILDINSYYCWNTEMRKISALVGLRKVSLKRWNLYWKDSGSRKEREISLGSDLLGRGLVIDLKIKSRNSHQFHS